MFSASSRDVDVNNCAFLAFVGCLLGGKKSSIRWEFCLSAVINPLQAELRVRIGTP